MAWTADTLVWAVLWLGLFLALELTGLFFGPTGMAHPGLVPWSTLSEYVWDIEGLKPWGSVMTAGVLLFFAGLSAHLVARWTP